MAFEAAFNIVERPLHQRRHGTGRKFFPCTFRRLEGRDADRAAFLLAGAVQKNGTSSRDCRAVRCESSMTRAITVAGAGRSLRRWKTRTLTMSASSIALLSTRSILG